MILLQAAIAVSAGVLSSLQTAAFSCAAAGGAARPANARQTELTIAKRGMGTGSCAAMRAPLRRLENRPLMSLTNFEGIEAAFALVWRCASALNLKFAHTMPRTRLRTS